MAQIKPVLSCTLTQGPERGSRLQMGFRRGECGVLALLLVAGLVSEVRWQMLCSDTSAAGLGLLLLHNGPSGLQEELLPWLSCAH